MEVRFCSALDNIVTSACWQVTKFNLTIDVYDSVTASSFHRHRDKVTFARLHHNAVARCEAVHMPVNVVVIMAFAFWAADAERRHTIAAVPNTFFVSAVLATVCHDAESFFVVMTTGSFQFAHFSLSQKIVRNLYVSRHP